MTEVAVQFSVKTSSARHGARERNSSRSTNLFHQGRNLVSPSPSILPLISFQSFADLQEKLLPNKSMPLSSTPLPMDYRLKMPFNDRSRSIYTPRTPLLARPPTSHRTFLSSQQQHQQQQQQQQQQRTNDLSPRRNTSARTPIQNVPILPRPHPQYNHFLAYLRRQSLARLRRRMEQDDGNVETTVIFNHPKVFHSPSNLSVPETTSMPMIASSIKRNVRPTSSSQSNTRLTPRSTSMHSSRLISTPLSKLKKIPEDEAKTNSASFLITPANSIVEEIIVTPMKTAPYELQLTGDTLNYCYVSDSGMKYQGQLLSTAV